MIFFVYLQLYHHMRKNSVNNFLYFTKHICFQPPTISAYKRDKSTSFFFIANFLEHNMRICVCMLFQERNYQIKIFQMLNIHGLSCWHERRYIAFKRLLLFFLFDASLFSEGGKYIRVFASRLFWRITDARNALSQL